MSNMSNPISKKTHGSGQPIVLLHGILQSHKYWDKVVKHIPKEEFHITRPDIIGFGSSNKPTNLSYNIDDHANTLLEHVLTDIDQPFILVGHSMGAMIASRIAKLKPVLVKRLVLINPPLFSSPQHAKQTVMKNLPLLYKIYVSKLGGSIYMVRNNSAVKYLLSASLSDKQNLGGTPEDYLRHSRKSFILSLRNTIYEYSVYNDLQKIKTETKYIYSTQDPFYDPASQIFFKTHSHMRSIELTGGHNIPFESAERVAQEICS